MNFSFIITSDRFHLGTEKTTCNTDMNVKMEKFFRKSSKIKIDNISIYNIIKHIKDAFERSYKNDTQTYLNNRNTLFW